MADSWKAKNKQKPNIYDYYYTINVPQGSLFADNIMQDYVYNFPYYLKLEEINHPSWDLHVKDLKAEYMMKLNSEY